MDGGRSAVAELRLKLGRRSDSQDRESAWRRRRSEAGQPGRARAPEAWGSRESEDRWVPRSLRGLVDLIKRRDAEGLHPGDEQRVIVIGGRGVVPVPVPQVAQVRALVMLLVGVGRMVS